MSTGTDTRRVSARLPDGLYADLEQLVEDDVVESKSVVIRDGIQREVDRLMGRDGGADIDAVLDRLDDLDDDLKRVIRGEFSRVASRDRSGP